MACCFLTSLSYHYVNISPRVASQICGGRGPSRRRPSSAALRLGPLTRLSTRTQSRKSPMTLPKHDVQRWLGAVAPQEGLTRLALDAGLPRLRLVQQLSSGNVAEATISAVARSRGIDPLAALASFGPYSALRPAHPTPSEALALIEAGRLLRAAGAKLEGADVPEAELGPAVFEGASRQWFIACDTGSMRESIAATLGLSRSGLWRMLNSTIRPDVAALVSAEAGTSLSAALVVAEVLTPTEAGWRDDERARVLSKASVAEVLHVAEVRSHEAALKGRQDENFMGHLG